MSEPALATQIPTPAAATPLRVVETASHGAEMGAEAVPARPIPPPARLELPAYDLDAALGLERELGISHVLAQILVRRGLADPHRAREFLDGRERHPPSAFTGIDRAVLAIQIGRAHV